MATILLQIAGSAIGSLFGPVGLAIGSAIGGAAGSLIDRSLLGGGGQDRSVGVINSARIPGADEGAPILTVSGTMRVAGTMIWATRFEETVTQERAGGKGGGPKVNRYSYTANFAVGICEGEIAHVRRIFADGREIDPSAYEIRLYKGSADQLPDPLIEAKQDTGKAPAWRGLAYAVFERLPLEGFGNRIPAIQFEVVRTLGALERQVQAICLIPGASEHGYATEIVTESDAPGSVRALNRTTLSGQSDIETSLDELTALCPNLKAVALVTAWFGNDLRAGHCTIEPRVEVAARAGESRAWRVGGIGRGTASLVSRRDGAPAYGGTPDDRSVIEAIRAIRSRGLKVFLYPFLLMDVQPGNGLPDPYGGAEQAAYPWRGRMSAALAPGVSGTPDRTVLARAEITAFLGTATPADFLTPGASVQWADETGPGYRRFVLHHAALARAAGGVDGFLIGSEMTGLTRLRDEAGAFPFVEGLTALAGDVKTMIPDAAVTYAADWSEYSGYRPDDGTGDVFFHLDALWADPSIDAVGIDNYMPVSDWRDDDATAGNPDGFRSASDTQAMQRAVTSGEGYDWYYADLEGRSERTRLPIRDGALGKDWVFRFKDIASWWENLHFDRPGGVEAAAPTLWQPGMKPVWFTELGCPAVDKGAVQPNVFPDPASSEGGYPYFSSRNRDDLQQRAFLEAHFHVWTGPEVPDGMVDPERIFLWSYDARPFPAFPTRADLWADGANWRTGHWLNGRMGGVALRDLIKEITVAAGLEACDVSAVEGMVSGHVRAGPVAPRAVLEPLIEAFAIDVREGPSGLVFSSRMSAARPAILIDAVADTGEGALIEERRAQEADLANEAAIRFADPLADHQPSSARSRRLAREADRRADLALDMALDAGMARLQADRYLRDLRIARRSVRFALSPQDAALEPGDRIAFSQAGAPAGTFRITHIADREVREIEAVAHEPAMAGSDAGGLVSRASGDGEAVFAPAIVLADLPPLGTSRGANAMAAAYARPFAPMVLSTAPGTEGFSQRATIEAPARIGRLSEPLSAGRSEGRISYRDAILADFPFGAFETVSRLQLLHGANAFAVLADNGAYEIIQAERAEEVAPGRWRFSGLLRGQAGTDDAMLAGAAAGSSIVALDDAVVALPLTDAERGLPLHYVAERLGGAAGGAPFATFAGGERGLTPFSPVHVRARRTGAGVEVRWVRRGRLDADNWSPAEIPMDEGTEAYRIEVLSGATVKRTVAVAAPVWIYPQADELADFGALQSALSVRIAQAGLAVPFGIAREATIEL